MKILSVITILWLMVSSCNSNQSPRVPEDAWILGNHENQLKTIEKHIRGFDMTMVETDYRYQELYWVGRDQNWEYADYLLGKIQYTMENGLERRPKRAKSASNFMNYTLPEFKRIIELKDSTEYSKGFIMLTQACNSCHQLENMPFFSVTAPEYRQSSIRFNR
jgi:hypothetical protein